MRRRRRRNAIGNLAITWLSMAIYILHYSGVRRSRAATTIRRTPSGVHRVSSKISQFFYLYRGGLQEEVYLPFPSSACARPPHHPPEARQRRGRGPPKAHKLDVVRLKTAQEALKVDLRPLKTHYDALKSLLRRSSDALRRS